MAIPSYPRPMAAGVRVYYREAFFIKLPFHHSKHYEVLRNGNDFYQW